MMATNDLEKESIYQLINRMAAEHQGLPYPFQEVSIAGKVEVGYFIWEEKLPHFLRERLAMELADLLAAVLNDPALFPKLRAKLEEKPPILFLTEMNQRMKLLLSEDRIDRDLLYAFGMHLSTESDREQEVKLGMLILGFFENDFVRKIMKVLGYHSVFTLYALEAARNWKDHPNVFIFDLAKNTRGYGKLAALFLLNPITAEQKRWVFEHGAVNEAVPHLSAILCLEKPDMNEFYQNLVITKESFPHLSNLLAYAAEERDIKKLNQSLFLIEKYLAVARNYAKSFIDLAALVVLEKNMTDSHNKGGVDSGEESGWTSDRKNEIKKRCAGILKQSKWHHVAALELSEPKVPTSLMIKVLKRLRLLPPFHDFALLLGRDPFDLDLAEFFLVENPSVYLDPVYHYIKQVLPAEVLGGRPLHILEDQVTGLYQPDFWLVYLLQAMRKEGRYEENFALRCLTARFPDARMEAIQLLRGFKKKWSDRVMPALVNALGMEPMSNVRKSLLRLMGKAGDGKEKEQRYVDVSEMKIETSPWDLPLLKTKIAGTGYRDLLVVEGRIESGDILYLVREPDNPYDDKAILVTAEDGYVLGYLPRVDNLLPATLLDAGEKLYAILLSDDVGAEKPEIQIMLSKGSDISDHVIPFPPRSGMNL